MGKDNQSIEIVPNDESLGVVAGWLGMSAEAAVGEMAQEQEQEAPARTPFLGLGAKYLPHHKAVGFAAALDTKLKRRLEAGRKRSAQQAAEEAEAAGFLQGASLQHGVGAGLGTHGAHSNKASQRKANGQAHAPGSAQQQGVVDEDEEEEEDLGKARLVRARPQPPGPGAGAALQGSQQHAHAGGAAAPGKHQHQQPKKGVGPGDAGRAGAPLPGSRAAREALLLGTGQQHSNGQAEQQPGKKKKRKRKHQRHQASSE